jgi:DNA helicase-2/ATP-dependent DNA helicase PcrA
MNLNEEQTLAVQHPPGKPAVLIAGAGSGKTRVLTERVRWLLAEQGVPPRRVCAVTFTNKAAGELISRLGLDRTSEKDVPRVGTLHSLTLGGIRKGPQGFGFRDKVSPMDEYDQSQLMKKIIERWNAAHGTERDVNAYSVLEKIGFHRARGVGFRDEYTDAVHDKAMREHAGYHAMTEEFLDLWELFEDEKRKSSLIDFDDMLWLFNRRARTDEVWLERVQKQFDHVLVDEAQDLSPVQWECVEHLLAPDNPNLYVVGDMSQSIYGFNGAVPRILKEYSEGWRGTVPTLYRIARNHRSGRNIVFLANKIQTTMTETIPLQMQTFREEDGNISVKVGCLPMDIANSIAADIQRDARRKKDPTPYKDNAILVRSAIQIRDIEGELVRRRIPYIVRGGRGLLQTEEVRDILSYLRLATNHKDFTAFMRCCSVPRCGVGEVALNKLRISANEAHGGDLIEAAKENPRLHNLVGIVEQVTVFKDAPMTALEKVLALFDYRKFVEQKYKGDPQKVVAKHENIDRFIFMVASLTEETGMTLDDLIFQMALDRPKGDEADKALYDRQLASGELTQEQYDAKMKEIENGAVTISTIHSAKGLEWKRVFATNLYEGSLPHRFSMGSDEEVEEERRLFYVACTRPQDDLVLCIPEKAGVQGTANTQRLAPSRFLAEIGVTKPTN